MKKHIIAIAFIFTIHYSLFTIHSFAQQLYPLNRDMTENADELLISQNPSFHTENKPYILSDLRLQTSDLSLMTRDSAILSSLHSKFWSFIWRKVRKENLIRANNPDFSLTIDPLFDFGYGKFHTSDKSYSYTSTYMNTRGVIIKGVIGKNVAFYSTIYENQARFIDYLDANLKKRGVIPGEGRWKTFKDNAYQYDYSSATGLVSWSPSTHINLQFGNDKNFIGDGYRSLLLSDNSFSYPFLKTKFNFGRFEYSNIYAGLQTSQKKYSYDLGVPFQKKYATMHLLSLNAAPGLNIALFESTIWKAHDGNEAISFQLHYLNPVIGMQALMYNLNQENNTMVGLNLSYKFRKHYCIYGQFVADDITHNGEIGNYNNKFGYQLGIKYYDILNIKNLYFQTEFNAVRPYTYAHPDSIQSYTHYNQSLTDPLGANFLESITFLNYRYKDFLFELKYNYAVYGADYGDNNFGSDIFKSQDPNEYIINQSTSKIAQGLRNTVIYTTLRIYFLLNPVTNMNIYLEVSDRTQKAVNLNYHSTYINFGIKTNLNNFYHDF
jgi:hypothetical protein